MKKRLFLLFTTLLCVVCCSCMPKEKSNVVSEPNLEVKEEEDVEVFKLNKKLGNDDYLLNREVKSIDSIETYTIYYSYNENAMKISEYHSSPSFVTNGYSTTFSNYTESGKPLSGVGGEYTYSFEYDALDNVVSVYEYKNNSLCTGTFYTYDEYGNMTQLKQLMYTEKGDIYVSQHDFEYKSESEYIEYDSWNGTRTGSTRHICEYDEYGNKIKDTEYDYKNGPNNPIVTEIVYEYINKNDLLDRGKKSSEPFDMSKQLTENYISKMCGFWLGLTENYYVEYVHLTENSCYITPYAGDWSYGGTIESVSLTSGGALELHMYSPPYMELGGEMMPESRFNLYISSSDGFTEKITVMDDYGTKNDYIYVADTWEKFETVADYYYSNIMN